MTVRELRGHSGCRVTLERGGTGYFVRKMAPAGYEHRLRRQWLRQRELSAQGWNVPEVLRNGTRDGRYGFDMAFVRGRDSVGYLAGAGRYELHRARDMLVGRMAVRISAAAIPVAAFAGKLHELNAPDWLTAADWSCIPESEAHGDMTLENVIWTDAGPVFIDPLDGPFLSSWLDYAKLHQDLTAGWFLRHRPNRNAGIAAAYLRSLLTDWARRELPGAHDRLNQLLAFQLCRIRPYCRDEASRQVIETGLKELAP